MTNWMRALLLSSALGLSACGGGGGGGPSAPVNSAPTANFAFSCADLACTFTSTSTDQDVGDAIVQYAWNFGDTPSGVTPVLVTTANASHTFAAAGTYNVTLNVADKAQAVGTIVRPVTVTAPPVPAAPHAAFTVSCISLDCTFSDTSTFDAGSVLQSRLWDFGDSVTLAATNPAPHHYAVTALTTFTTKLTIVDAAGKTSTSAQTIVVAPPATTLNCAGGNCTLALTTASRVTATLLSHSCGAQNNQFVITAPVTQTIFPNGCFDAVGVPVAVNGGSTFAAGTVLQVAVLSGTVPGSSLVFPPTIRLTGDFANGWTLTFDDGFGGPGEPDFNDLVIVIKAAP